MADLAIAAGHLYRLDISLTAKIAFFDRDGVLNKNIGYAHRPEDCQLMPGAGNALNLVAQKGFKIVVVTNQSGIARGYYDESALIRFNDHLQGMLAKDGNAPPFDHVFHCPHHPEHGIAALKTDCRCRKPQPGMILDGLALYAANPNDCFLVGDKQSDIEAANKAGIDGYLYTEGRLDDLVSRILAI